MSVNLSIKNVPNELAKKLRRRALRHHRSIQGELMTILTECLIDQEQVTVEQAFEQSSQAGLAHPVGVQAHDPSRQGCPLRLWIRLPWRRSCLVNQRERPWSNA
ncbi:MAG: FitA-like ribbon-helix-helix domain-containing protein [Acidobacteriota bacterium]